MAITPALFVFVGNVRTVAFILGLRFLSLNHVLDVKVNRDCLTDPNYLLLFDSLFLLLFFFALLNGWVAIDGVFAQSLKVQHIAIFSRLIVIIVSVLFDTLSL